MLCHCSAHASPIPAALCALSTFLDDARENLHIVRHLFGAESRRYRRLVQQYQHVAEALDCQPDLERVLHAVEAHDMSHLSADADTADAERAERAEHPDPADDALGPGQS